MKIDNSTLNVLKNFSVINPSILINEGDVVRTMSPTKTVFAKAKVNQKFGRKFAIYDLSKFLNAVSMFDGPVLEFEEGNKATITSDDDNRKFNFMFADINTVIAPPDKDISFDNIVVTFELKNKALSDLIKAMGILQLPEIAIVGDGKSIYAKAVNSKASGSTYSEKIGTTDKEFTAYFKAENFKMIPNDYVVNVANKGTVWFAQFVGPDVEYWIAIEANSKF